MRGTQSYQQEPVYMYYNQNSGIIPSGLEPVVAAVSNMAETREVNLSGRQMQSYAGLVPPEHTENTVDRRYIGISGFTELDFVCKQLELTKIGSHCANTGICGVSPIGYSDCVYCEDDICTDGPSQSAGYDEQTVFKQDTDSDTLLHVAIILGKEDEALGFINIATEPDLLSIQNFICQTPLHLAVITRQARVARRLVVAGVQLESRDKTGNTPLHLACREGSAELIDVLTEPISNEEKQENRFETVTENVHQILEIPNYDGLPCIHVAAELGHYDLLRYLILKGADINSTDRKTGRTVLHKAAIDGDENLVQMLLSFPSCDIDAKAFDDNTPFDFARDREYHSITYELAAEATRRAKSGPH